MKQFLAIIVFAIAFLPGRSQTTMGLISLESGSVEGYNLLAPFSSDTIFLIDNCGQIVHSWASEFTLGSAAYLLDNGDLLRLGSVRNTPFANSATCGVIERMDWEGNQVWKFDLTSVSTCMHHDLELLPNGNVLVIAYGLKSESEAINAGRDVNRISVEGIWEDMVLEIQQTGPETGIVVWEWHAWDHLIQDYDPNQNGYGVVSAHPELIDINFPIPVYDNNPASPDWMHSNSIDYHPELDQIMISSRHTSEIWIIDHSTTPAEAAGHNGGVSGRGGDLLYRWGNPQIYKRGGTGDQYLYGQHDARWIEPGHPWEGKIMIFNNGDPSRPYSTIEVIQPPINTQGNYALLPDSTFGPEQAEWVYDGGNEDTWYSPFISGAQPLSNGHILICDGPVGRIFEIDSLGEHYWEYINPITSLGAQEQGAVITQNYLFKLDRYTSEYPGFAGRELTPGNRIERNPYSLPQICLESPPGNDTITDLSAYPNPFRQEFRITTQAGETMELEVYDLLGRIVQQKRVVENGERVDTSDWLPGVYLLHFGESPTKILKVLKIR